MCRVLELNWTFSEKEWQAPIVTHFGIRRILGSGEFLKRSDALRNLRWASNEYDPCEYSKNRRIPTHGIGNRKSCYFASLYWLTNLKRKNSLLIGRPIKRFQYISNLSPCQDKFFPPPHFSSAPVIFPRFAGSSASRTESLSAHTTIPHFHPSFLAETEKRCSGRKLPEHHTFRFPVYVFISLSV